MGGTTITRTKIAGTTGNKQSKNTIWKLNIDNHTSRLEIIQLICKVGMTTIDTVLPF